MAKQNETGNADRREPDSRFFNRELSWIEFNARVLGEALDRNVPPLERLKFLSIVSSNFDEFFMIRIASLRRQASQNAWVRCPSGLTVEQILTRAFARFRELVDEQYRCLLTEILPDLERNGLAIVRPPAYSASQMKFIQHHFEDEVFPLLTPIRVEPGEPFPFTRNLRFHIAFLMEPTGGENQAEQSLAIMEVPSVLDRFVALPSEQGRLCFAMIEDIILRHAGLLFPGYAIREHVLFRVTRDADLSVDEERDEDFVEAMEELLLNRERSTPVRLVVSGGSSELTAAVIAGVGLTRDETFEVPGPLDLKDFMALAAVHGFERLRYEPWTPAYPPVLTDEVSIWDVLKREDILLHHPYESFDPVVRMVTEAAGDPKVLAIKMTMYRTSGDSPIVRALGHAAENGKQVIALVELKARFDEERNIEWAQRLEQAGVIVVYGIARLKVHSKALLIVRKEPAGMKRYLHLGTGNYNDRTARLYTDFGMLTAREDLTREAAFFFNAITGYSTVPSLRKLAMAPMGMKDRLLKLIDREAQKSISTDRGMIMAKMNALADPEVIEALYRASRAGVRIFLNVRGICMLIPGVEGMSENITVTSIVDRYLEHSRIFCFHNGGAEEVFLSSADWMPRNLDRRVELMFPVEQENLKERLIEVLRVFFRDNTKSHILQSDGTYRRKLPKRGEEMVRSQELFHREARNQEASAHTGQGYELTVRRKPPG